MGLSELSAVLWRERDVLEVLLFKLQEEQLLLAADHVRWLPRATREVEVVLEEVSRTELARAVESEGVAIELGLAPEASLLEISAVAPEPWGELLVHHRTALQVCTSEVRELARVNEHLLRRGSLSLANTLHDLMSPRAAEPDSYRPDGRATTGTARTGTGRLLDGRV
jgi:hypothetical protein